MNLRDLLWPRACKADESLSRLIDGFRHERSEEMAKLVASGSRCGAQLAMARQDAARWRDYAVSLERLCLRHGLDIPPRPDE